MNSLFYSEPHVPPCRSVNEVPLQAQRLKTSTLWHCTFGCVLVTIVSQNLGIPTWLVSVGFPGCCNQSLHETEDVRYRISYFARFAVSTLDPEPFCRCFQASSTTHFCFIQWHMYGFPPRCCRLPPSALIFGMIWHGDDFSNLRNAIGIFPSKPAARAKPWRIEGETS